MLCTKCLQNQRTVGQRWCLSCRASYMREWRKNKGGNKSLTAEQKYKSNSRSYANIYQRRGKLVPAELCEGCKEVEPNEKHHENYDYPLVVVWLCRKCHIRVTMGLLKVPLSPDEEAKQKRLIDEWNKRFLTEEEGLGPSSKEDEEDEL